MTIIETPAPPDVEEQRNALLYIMLSHTKHTLERFLQRQQRRNTLKSLEAAEAKQDLQTVTAWLHEFKGDTTMHDAFAALADEIEAQLMQEVADVMTVWEWVGTRQSTYMSAGFILLNGLTNTFRSDRLDGEYLHAAAEWVRKQGEP